MDAAYNKAGEVIDEIVERIKARDLVFFVGSAISFRKPSNLPSVADIKAGIIQALCAKNRIEWFHMIYSDETLTRRINSIRHEEFLELIYRTAGDVAIRILDCLNKGSPNANHFFLAEGLGRYFDVILTTNQDPLIEQALDAQGKKVIRVTRYGDKIYESGKIIKLHGCTRKPDTIITLLRQLVRGLPRSRSHALKKVVESRPVLFTGYSGQDEDTFRVLVGSQCKRIYWNVRTRSENLNRQVEKLYWKYGPSKFLLFEYDLNDLFETLGSRLNFERRALCPSGAPYVDPKQIFDDWGENLSDEGCNVLGRILGNDRLAKYQEALQCFGTTLTLVSAETKEGKHILGKTHYFIGDAYMDYKTSRDNYGKTHNAFKEAARYFSELNDAEGEANALIGMGESYRHRARYQNAIGSFEEAKRRLIGKKDEDCIAGKATRCLADVYRMQDKHDDALQAYRLAYKLFRHRGLIEDAVVSWIWLGEVYVYKGNYDKASWYNKRALRIADQYAFEQDLAWAKYVEADIRKYKGWNTKILKEEVQNLDKAFQKLENRLGQAWCNQMLAELYRLEENYDEAKIKCTEATKLCGKNGTDYQVCLAYVRLNEAETLRAQGRYELAIDTYKQVLSTEIGSLQRHQAHAALGMAETNRMKGHGERDEYKRPLEIYEAIGMRHGVVHTLIGLALLASLAENENCLEILSQARAYCLERPRLPKELMLIEQIERNILKDILTWLHPLEFP